MTHIVVINDIPRVVVTAKMYRTLSRTRGPKMEDHKKAEWLADLADIANREDWIVACLATLREIRNDGYWEGWDGHASADETGSR